MKTCLKNFIDFLITLMLKLMFDILQIFLLYAWIPHRKKQDRILYLKLQDSYLGILKLMFDILQIFLLYVLVSNDKLFSLFLFFNDNQYQGDNKLEFWNRLAMMKSDKLNEKTDHNSKNQGE